MKAAGILICCLDLQAAVFLNQAESAVTQCLIMQAPDRELLPMLYVSTPVLRLSSHTQPLSWLLNHCLLLDPGYMPAGGTETILGGGGAATTVLPAGLLPRLQG